MIFWSYTRIDNNSKTTQLKIDDCDLIDVFTGTVEGWSKKATFEQTQILANGSEILKNYLKIIPESPYDTDNDQEYDPDTLDLFGMCL
jgi:hypothetical protein